jgi:hypothetical protein
MSDNDDDGDDDELEPDKKRPYVGARRRVYEGLKPDFEKERIEKQRRPDSLMFFMSNFAVTNDDEPRKIHYGQWDFCLRPMVQYVCESVLCRRSHDFIRVTSSLWQLPLVGSMCVERIHEWNTCDRFSVSRAWNLIATRLPHYWKLKHVHRIIARMVIWPPLTTLPPEKLFLITPPPSPPLPHE